MTLGPLMLDLDGLTLDAEEVKLLQNSFVGGIILFSRNFDSRQQITDLIKEIRSIRPELLICVDQEGGRVQRFREGFTRIPPMQLLGDRLCSGSGNPEVFSAAEALLRDSGWLMASELLACGLDFSFAPVLDVDKAQCEVIADRSFSDDAEWATRAAALFIEGMHEAGMSATGKHFPGHGGVLADSHMETPFDSRNLVELRARDMVPFSRLSKTLDAVMPAHIVFPSVDDKAVGFSSFWLQKVLREELGFNGVIFSDDLSMKGADVAGSYADKARCALHAGCDMVLVCNNRQGAIEVLDYLSGAEIKPSSRLVAMKGQAHISWASLISCERWHRTASELSHLT
jgi:beta-N-acetylhexosaminidase